MKKVLYGLIAVVLLLTTTSSNNAFANNQETDSPLIDDQIYDAYVEGTGFKIDPSIGLDSTDSVNVIVEFNALAPVMSKKYESKGAKSYSNDEIAKMHTSFAEFVNKNSTSTVRSNNNTKSTEWKITNKYSNVFVGVSMTLPANEIEELSLAPEVLRIWPDEEFTIEPSFDNELETKSTKSKTKMINTVPALDIDQLHAKGITGNNIKVGVLDTGIDYNHPDLSSSYNGYKYVSDADLASQDYNSTLGWDFIDNDADPMEATYADYVKANAQSGVYDKVNGRTYWTSHGTHVSGTIAGTAENTLSEYATLGVAPGAQLYGYRVLGPYGSGSTAQTLAGIEKSVIDGMDVINLSLGNSYSHDLFPTSLALNNAALSGTVPVVAAGNSGPTFNTVGSPGSSALAITVGASNLDRTYKTTDLTINSKTVSSQQFTDNLNSDLLKLESTTQDVVFAGKASALDFISRGGTTLEDSNFKDKIALIERGDISFHEKILNAKLFGAKGAIIYNNVDGELEYYLPLSTEYIPTFKLSKADGETIYSQLEEVTSPTNNRKIMVGEVSIGTFKEETEYRNDLAALSSVGPIISSGEIKPDVVAPGVDILSAYPADVIAESTSSDYSQAYAQIQGTSMATPHVAGLVALMLQNNPNLSVEQVKSIITNTADPLNDDYSVFQTGGGRIAPVDAVESTYAIYAENKYRSYDQDMQVVQNDYNSGVMNFGIVYNNDQDYSATSKLKVDKISQSQLDLSLSIEYTDSSIDKMIQDASSNNVSLSLSSNKLSSDVTATLNVPKSAANGLYEGRIVVKNNNDSKDTRYIPFAVYKKEGGLYASDIYPPIVTAGCVDNPIGASKLAIDFGQPVAKMALYYVQDGERKGFMQGYDFSNSPLLSTGPIEILDGRNAGITSMYLPYDSSINGVADYYEYIEAGEADIEVEVIFEDGTTDSIINTVLVSYEQPTFENVGEVSGLYEYQNSDFGSMFDPKTVDVKYKVEDVNMDWLKNNASHSIYDVEYSNSRNYIELYTVDSGVIMPYMDAVFTGDENGIITMGFEKSDAVNGTTYLMNAYSRYTMCNTKEYEDAVAFTPANKTQAYGRLTFNKDEYEVDEDVVATYEAFNLSNASELYFRRLHLNRPLSGVASLESYEFTDEFKAYQEENNVEFEVEIVYDGTGQNSMGTRVKLVSAPDGYTGLSGNMPLLKLVYDGENSAETTSNKSIANLSIVGSYKKVGDTKTYNMVHYGVDFASRDNKNAYGTVVPTPEAFMDIKGSNVSFAYPKVDNFQDLNIQYTYNSTKGSKTNIISSTSERLFDFSATGSLNTIYVKTPGHTTELIRNRSGVYENGRVIGFENGIQGMRSITIEEPYGGYAGDVNADEIIDVLDLKAIYDARFVGPVPLTSSTLTTDINQDGVEDITDIMYIVNNMGLEAELAKDSASTHINKYKDMHYYLNVLGYDYENFNSRTYVNLFDDDNLTNAVMGDIAVTIDDEIDYSKLDSITEINSNNNETYVLVKSLGGINMLVNLETITLHNSSLESIDVNEEYANLPLKKIDLTNGNLTSITGNKLENLEELILVNTDLTQIPDYVGLYDNLDLNIDQNHILNFSKLDELEYKVNVGTQTSQIKVNAKYDSTVDTKQYYEFEIPTITNSLGEEINYEEALVSSSSDCTITGNKVKCLVDLDQKSNTVTFNFKDDASKSGEINVEIDVLTSYEDSNFDISDVLSETGFTQLFGLMLVSLVALLALKKLNKKSIS